MPAGRQSFAALPDATSGPGARKTARRRYASSAIPTSSAPTAPWAASSRAPGSLRSGWRRNGPSGTAGRKLVVLTGGEPLLQVDAELIEALHAQGFEIAVETNGTVPAPAGLDWICVSPKAGAPLKQTRGQELKVVVPQSGLDLDTLADLPFEHHFLQPMDGPQASANTRWAIERCLQDPRWRLSVQTHKVLNIR